jgi:lambda family phage minor tail protein L
MTVESEVQKLDQDASIILVEIVHATAGTIRLSNGSVDPSDLIAYGGNTYSPRQISVKGGLTASGNKMPRPTISFDNVDGFWWATAFLNDDLKGATVSYKEVYRANLDDGGDPDGSAYISSYSFIIRQMKSLESQNVRFQLVTSIDRDSVMFGRQCLRHVCQRTYRVPDSGTPDTFFSGTCPYVGANYFAKDGSVEASYLNDDCGQEHADCVLRFPTGNLPYQGFVSIGQKQT